MLPVLIGKIGLPGTNTGQREAEPPTYLVGDVYKRQLTLIWWTNIQEAIISSYSLFVIINITLGDFANGYFHFFYLQHDAFGLFQ